ncbi:MAG: biotin--[acetyl-CoA-carboxylase] ligase [Coriobacteriales bacterium]|nr:biotin--[acetyl-CoA-carboxylase] ligase [Coriobacteriales bacterium]
MAETRDLVLEALVASAGAPVSGEAIAHDLGVSRAAVAKHVASLKESGFEITAQHGTGYSIDLATVLAPPAVSRFLADPASLHLLGGGDTGSTMDDARALVERGAPDGTVVLASRQTSGRGRLGRSWESPKGGVYFSLIARPTIPVAEAVSLPLAACLGIAEGLDSLGAHASVKWPNDLELEGGKLAGILMEMSAEADCVAWVIIGVGINVLRPDEPIERAAYLESSVPGLPLSQVAAVAVDGIRSAIAEAGSAGFASMRGRYERRFVALGHEVVLTNPDGTLVAEGIARGIDEVGRLVVARDDGELIVSSGDLSLRAHPTRRADRDSGPLAVS